VSEVDDVKNFIHVNLELQRRALDALEKYGPGMIRAMMPTQIAMYPVPPWVRNELAEFWIDRLMEAIAYARKVNRFLTVFVMYMGSPDNLRAAHRAIAAAVTGPAKDYAIQNLLEDNLDAMDDPDQWDGPGSVQYRKGFDGQREAFTRVSEFTQVLEDTLTGLATTIEDFYYGVKEAVVSYIAIVGGLAVAVATSPTVIGAVGGIIVALLGVLGMVNSIITMVNSNTRSTETMLEDLMEVVQNWPAPKFVVL
jgi:hypothetical protein